MERVFLPFDAELKDEIEKIRFEIQAQQNGVASRSMGCDGYKKNYGVTIPELRRIATPYVGNQKLAQCLWNARYRETMIIATMIYPVDKMDRQTALEWVGQMDNIEIAQYASANLLSRLSCANDLVDDLLASDARCSRDLAYLVAAQLIEDGKKFDFDKLLSCAEADVLSASGNLPVSVSLFLKQVGLYSAYKEVVLAMADKFSSSDKMLVRWVAEEVRTFVEYTDSRD